MCKIVIMSLLCIAGALINVAIHEGVVEQFPLPLFLDTITTVSFTLLYGPVFGGITGALTNIFFCVFGGWGWDDSLYALCNIATALITWLFVRLFPRELDLRQSQNAPMQKALLYSLRSRPRSHYAR